ncbi:hypothetical protein HCN44_010798 [Aphidius gifuensis]|uniref:BEN domain-containing protein n=1 Tax=Aphidius gifuensis TaxID=684658 RepID=A0A834Y1W9_APHGI|nr:hypothetical protein HCN44_010798 [Aphidius gifuensis]
MLKKEASYASLLIKFLVPETVLATHSRTGKKSNAFLNRAAKPGIDERIITAIYESIKKIYPQANKSFVLNGITSACNTASSKVRKQARKNSGSNPARKNSGSNQI